MAFAFMVMHLLMGGRTGTLQRDDLVFAAPLLMATLAFGGTGAIIVSRQPRNTIGWLLVSIPFIANLGFFLGDYATYGLVTSPGSLPAARFAAWIDRWDIVAALVIFIPLFVLFPDGRLPSPRWRPVLWLSIAGPALAIVAFAVTPGRMTGSFAHLENVNVVNPVGLARFRSVVDTLTLVGGFASVAAAFLAGASLFFRYRGRQGDERQQVKWLALVGLAFLGEFLLLVALNATLADNTPGSEMAGTIVFALMFFTLALGIPAACAVAVLKYRLYDIDVVINKTLVYFALAAFITAVYVGVVVGIGSAIGRGDQPNLGLSILATAVVAVVFQPVRERVQHLANRLVYGKRATPYEVLSEFGHRMASVYASEEVLPRMARILAEGTGAREARVWLRVFGELQPAASWPDGGSNGSRARPEDADLVVRVTHQGEDLGALSITKAPGERLNPAEEKLARDLASQAGLVLRNVRLIEDLKASRVRLVQAQDSERRRIERNIHDGAQQQLVALNVKLGLAKTMASKDPAKAEALLAQLQDETNQALQDLRDLARGIFPPLLQDQGLKAALEAQARKSPVPVTVEADAIGRYPQGVEAAVYFCVLEALQNVAKYAGASHATVRLLAGDGTLGFEVIDDGAGFDLGQTSYGTGLQGMADRLEALGGSLFVESRPGVGAKVSGRLPSASPTDASGGPLREIFDPSAQELSV